METAQKAPAVDPSAVEKGRDMRDFPTPDVIDAWVPNISGARIDQEKWKDMVDFTLGQVRYALLSEPPVLEGPQPISKLYALQQIQQLGSAVQGRFL